MLAVKLSVTAAFLAWIFEKYDWSELWAETRKLEFATWLGVFACFAAAHAIGMFKWRYVINLGRSNLKLRDALKCYCAGMFANLCLPSIVGGDAVKAVLAGRATGRFEAAVIGGASERLIDTFALLVLIAVGSALGGSALPGWLQQTLVVLGLIAVAGAVLFLPLLLRVKLARWPKKLRPAIGRSLVSLRRLGRRPLAALWVFTLSMFLQSVFVLLNAWLGRGIGVDAPLAAWFFAVPFTKAITLVPISFGGFGLREKTLASFLFAVAAVPQVQGVAASILWQSVLVTTGLSCGAVWFLLGASDRAKSRLETSHA